jgi:hypothetical protein
MCGAGEDSGEINRREAYHRAVSRILPGYLDPKFSEPLVPAHVLLREEPEEEEDEQDDDNEPDDDDGEGEGYSE